ncbi:MAG: tetratricopeptide repeat protein [Hyphomonadaceae bacterium]
MRAAIALFVAAGLAACLAPVRTETVELAWEQCDGAGAPEFRLSQCSAVIAFPGTTPERRAAALIVRGAIRTNQGEYARALADFGRAMRIDRNNPQAYFERGLVHQARGAYDFAIRDFDLALTLQPNLQPALDRRAEALQLRNQAFLTELAQLNEALAETPTNSGLLNNRCWIRAINDADLPLALVDCNAAILADPTNTAALDSRGLVHLKLQNYEAALADYEAAFAAEPERGHFLYGRGLARLGLGQAAEGQSDLAEAERLEPGITAIYRTYGATEPAPPSQGD